MATDTNEPRSLIPWRARAAFTPGKTRRQRQAQYRQQLNALTIAIVAAILFGGVFALFNYRQVGSAKDVSCDEYPEYCVPLAGGAEADAAYAALENTGSREFDASSNGVEGVVRYIDDIDGVMTATIGDPNAPVHFVTTSDFACSHCQSFHQGDLLRFIDEYVLTGQATVGHMLLTGTGGTYSDMASQAALCAGEQGAFWELGDEFFRLASSRSPQSAFALSNIRDTANGMGLDGGELLNCINTRRYSTWIPQYSLWASDHGVTGTPTVLVKVGENGQWERLGNRSYDFLASVVESYTDTP